MKLSKERLDEIKQRCRPGDQTWNAADVPGLLAHIDALQSENMRLLEAVRRAVQTCRSERKNWTGDIPYNAWTKEIEYYESLLELSEGE